MKKMLLFSAFLSLSFLGAGAQSISHYSGTLYYRPESTLLLNDFGNNSQTLTTLIDWIKITHKEATAGSHLHLVAYYKEHTPWSINEASLRASTLRAYLRTAGHKQLRYTFALQQSATPLRVDVYCHPTPALPTAYTDIHYTNSQDAAVLKQSVARYPAIAYTSQDTPHPQPYKADSAESASKIEAIYFRWDKYYLDSHYMGNEQTLARIDQLLSHPIMQTEMDSIVVTATASPEGNPHYNQLLSEKRLKTMLHYFADKYPALPTDKYRTYAAGEDWEGLFRMTKADHNVPHREEVLALEQLALPKAEMEKHLRRIGGGTAYRYIEKNILRYLRTGATCVLFYPRLLNEVQPASPINSKALPPIAPPSPTEELPLPLVPTPSLLQARYIRPIAIKTNLLFDAATLFNIELEVPLGTRFSVLAEWTFPFWGGMGNDGGVAPLPAYSERYTLQMLSGTLEGRYWFLRSKSMTQRATRWGDYNALNGWFVGLFGGAGLYDFQHKGKGMQGEFYIASGISAGYAHPIAKHLHLEYSVGLGYVATRYYNYTTVDGHKVVNIRPDGRFDRRQQSFIGPTKLKVSLVWLPRFILKNKKGAPAK